MFVFFYLLKYNNIKQLDELEIGRDVNGSKRYGRHYNKECIFLQ